MIIRKNIPILFLIAAVAAPAWSGTVMLPPPPKQRYSDSPESFPESRFGYPPQRVRTGVPENYAATETSRYDEYGRADDWDGTGPRTDHELAASHPYAREATGNERTQWEEPMRGGAGRAPAGLEAGAPARMLESAPARQVAATDKTPSRAEDAPLGESSTAPRKRVPERVQAQGLIPSPEAEQMVIPKKGVQEVALIAGDLGYFPKTVFVTRDIPVRLFVTGASKSTLCIMMDSFQVRKQVRSQRIEEITFTPSMPGQYRFYCPVNGMEGTLVVRDVS